MKKAIASLVAVCAISSIALAAGKFKVNAPPVRAKKGQQATATLTFRGEGEFHFNTDYPFIVKLTAPTGVQLAKGVLKKDDTKQWQKEGVILPVVFTATEAGQKTITAEAKFAVCTDEECAPQEEKISIVVNVQ